MDPEERCEHVDVDIRRIEHFIDHARERLHAQLSGEPRTRCAAASDMNLIVMGAHGGGGLEVRFHQRMGLRWPARLGPRHVASR